MKVKIVHRKLGREKAMGQAWQDDGIIEIDERLIGFDRLEVYIHEFLHLQHPNWTEKTVELNGKQMASFLWQMGLRFVEEGKRKKTFKIEV